MKKILMVLMVVFTTTQAWGSALKCADEFGVGAQRCSKTGGEGRPQECTINGWQDIPLYAGNCLPTYGMPCVHVKATANCWCEETEAGIVEQNYYFTTLNQLSLFFMSGVHTVYGTIVITSSGEEADTGMFNVEELSCLRHVDYLMIANVEYLEEIMNGFDQLESVGTLVIIGNPNLKQIFSNRLAYVADDLVISENDDIYSIWLGGLTNVQDNFEIEENPALGGVGFKNLAYVGGDMSITDSIVGGAPTSFIFDSLNFIGGTWTLGDNTYLAYEDVCEVYDQLSGGPYTENFYGNLTDDCWDEVGSFSCNCP